MEPITIATAGALLKESAVVKGALDAAGAQIRAHSGAISRKIIDRVVVATQLGFNDYLVNSYNRCRFFKTILPPNQPLEVVSNYVNVTIKSSGGEIADDELVKALPKNKSVVITGLAGSGKSMLMKYLTVIHFEQPQGAIPLFVELRKLNSLTEKSLLSFIRLSCVSAQNTVTERQFDMALSTGAFMLVLDGFDEVNDEYKDEVQRQIIDVRYKYPKACIVVSSRPDDRFIGWSDFVPYKVKELSEQQCLKLIDSFVYDEGVKKRFAKEVKKSLYSTHRSFLSFPLLVTIMLLTYEEFAQVPTKMHEFYNQAFDTLYQKHDASKEQYKRITKTGLEKEDFRICFAAFCAFSYASQMFSFKDDQLEEKSRLAIKYLKDTNPNIGSIEYKDFVQDLFDSVCMLQKDGTDTAFVHRSFQEYFAALFVTRLSADKMAKVLDRYATRFHDSPISMAFSMAPETIESNWVAHTIDRLIIELGNKDVHWVNRFATAIVGRLGFLRTETTFRLTSYGYSPSTLGPLETISELYPSIFSGRRLANFGVGVSIKSVVDAVSAKSRLGKNAKAVLEFLSQPIDNPDGRVLEITKISPSDEIWLSAMGAEKSLNGVVASLVKARAALTQRETRRENLIEDLF